jgi:hypothetical protein
MVERILEEMFKGGVNVKKIFVFSILLSVLFISDLHADIFIIKPGETYITPKTDTFPTLNIRGYDIYVTWSGYFGLVNEEELEEISLKNLPVTIQRRIGNGEWESIQSSRISRFLPIIPKKCSDHIYVKPPTNEALDSHSPFGTYFGYPATGTTLNEYRILVENPNTVEVCCNINLSQTQISPVQ